MKSRILFLILTFLFLTACHGTFDVGIEHSATSTVLPAPAATYTQIPGNTANPTATIPAPTAALIPSNTPVPAVTATQAPSNTLAPAVTATLAPTITPAPISATPNYIDDRSTPSQVIVSFFNAINRQEYLRAYNYWSDPATSLGTLTGFANGYGNTASVDLVFGQITGDPGMSQVYYTIPILLKATAKNNQHTNFAACYIVHETAPDVYSEPPISPMRIDRGSAKPSSLNASDASVLASACSGYPVGGNPPFSASSNGLNIDKSNFVDNRSGPIETVSSLLNAINLKQYVRAYSYFQNPATFPGSFGPYAAGYSATDSITATFGAVQSRGAAGSLYYKVPVAMKVLNIPSATQTFVGCYTLQLAQPILQAAPPFQPLGIISSKFSQVTNGTDVNALLPTACN